ncbi:MAG TPA: pilin [Patescibacteria group bacterium]|nr:pilin [Patescibacteria group bacterium]
MNQANQLAILNLGQYNVPSSGISLANTVSVLVTLFLTIVSILAFIYLVLGGIRYITAGGDPKQIKAAKDQLTYAVIGLVVAIMSFAVINVFSEFFGVDLLSLPF